MTADRKLSTGQFSGPGGQGKLFMTPREIMDTHEPWDNDRHAVMGGGLHNHHHHESIYTGEQRSEIRYRGTGTKDQRTTGGTTIREHLESGPMETNQQLYARKLDEAQEDGLDWEIENEGVQIPLSLIPGAGPNPGTIANGHHRLAVAHDLDPNQLIPTLPAQNFHDISARGRHVSWGMKEGQPVRDLPQRSMAGDRTRAERQKLDSAPPDTGMDRALSRLGKLLAGPHGL